MTRTQTFTISGMHCASCTMLIDEVLEDLDGVDRSETSLRKRRTRVSFNPSLCSSDVIVDAIVEAGYTAVPLA